MGTAVCLPAGPDLTQQCEQCMNCLPKPFGKRGGSKHRFRGAFLSTGNSSYVLFSTVKSSPSTSENHIITVAESSSKCEVYDDTIKVAGSPRGPTSFWYVVSLVYKNAREPMMPTISYAIQGNEVK
ncbi:hypothetical protein DMENIID0001_037310 [Sergentomyia squamirostris]